MNLPFTKMQGLGNDFVVLNAANLNEFAGTQTLHQWQEQAPLWAKALCDRHFGVGADGLIVLFDLNEKRSYKVPSFVHSYPGSEHAQFAWTYTNADGSWSTMCGNGLRCAALYLLERGLVDKHGFSLSTAAGSVPVRFLPEQMIETDFGSPVLDGAKIPSIWQEQKCVGVTLKVECFDTAYDLPVTAVNFGNPHCVIFDLVKGDQLKVLDRSDRENLEKLAVYIQTCGAFPEGVNVSFAEVVSRDKINLLVFERGCGWTLACGSAAAATLVAGVLNEKVAKGCEIVLPGGSAYVSWGHDDRVKLSGPARAVFNGFLAVNTFAGGTLKASLRETVS
ncbi:MAG TPA: diaminopimelate epimerase [Oculatellaceae cyanobacterium]